VAGCCLRVLHRALLFLLLLSLTCPHYMQPDGLLAGVGYQRGEGSTVPQPPVNLGRGFSLPPLRCKTCLAYDGGVTSDGGTPPPRCNRTGGCRGWGLRGVRVQRFLHPRPTWAGHFHSPPCGARPVLHMMGVSPQTGEHPTREQERGLWPSGECCCRRG